jgi:Asp-tRNA(Asn)/Glu-tRNA(Gln) amidotransferase A subunit family amidase
MKTPFDLVAPSVELPMERRDRFGRCARRLADEYADRHMADLNASGSDRRMQRVGRAAEHCRGQSEVGRLAVTEMRIGGRSAPAVPCGFSPERLPISIQVVGRPFEEATVLRVGHAYQQATDWHRQRPRL